MSNFASKARSAVIWGAGFSLFRDCVQFCTMLALVRLLPQEAYGQFGFVTSVIGFIGMFAVSNFLAYSIQVKDTEDPSFQDHFTAGAFLNTAMCLVTNIVAIALYWSTTWREVAPFLHLMSIQFLLLWPSELRRRMIERNLDWKRLRSLHALGLVLSAVLALAMAWMGMGSYALLVPGLVVNFPFIYDLFVVKRWFPNWSWSWGRYKPAFQFGMARTGSGLLHHSRILLVSSTVVGIIGFAGLGVLNRSIGLADLFCIKVSFQLVSSIYPILTRIGESNSNVARVNSLVIQVAAWIVIPIALSLAMLASQVVLVVYGNSWVEVIPLLPYAMAGGVMSVFNVTGYHLLLARKKERYCMMGDALGLIGIGISLWLALPHGMIAYLVGAILTEFLCASFILYHLWSADGLSIQDLARGVLPAVISATVAILMVTIAFTQFRLSRSDSFILAFSWGGSFFAIYALILRLFFKRRIEVLLPYIPMEVIFRRVLRMPSSSM